MLHLTRTLSRFKQVHHYYRQLFKRVRYAITENNSKIAFPLEYTNNRIEVFKEREAYFQTRMHVNYCRQYRLQMYMKNANTLLLLSNKTDGLFRNLDSAIAANTSV